MTADIPVLPDPDPDPVNRSILFNTYQRARFLLGLAAVLAFIVFWGLGGLFHVPFMPEYADSILLQPSAAMAFVAVIVGLGLSVVIGTIIAGPVRYDAGLCTAGLGLLALSARGGPVREVLFAHPGADIYLSLFTELVLLFILFVAMFFFQRFFHTLGWLRDDARRDGLPDMEHTLTEKLQAAAIQIVVMGILVYFLAASERKFQVIAAVSFASFLATIAAHSIYPVRPSYWFWSGSFIVGAIGYLWAYAQPGDYVIGTAANPLARALPLDYASVGVGASIVGYWMSRRWRRDRISMEG
ncbi:MAG TPA: hypothetical protein VGG19_15725 [Tepidisphaeraceae bacterium]|jgi:hypothetical protein